MWMAALWDRTAVNYAERQDWSNDPHNMWEAELVMQATLCVQGWQDVKTHRMQQRVSSVQCPMLSSVQRPTSVADEDFMLVFTTVSKGIMAHGPVLAHVRQCGHDLAPMWCLPTCYNFDRSAWVALSDLAVGLAENPERTVGIILRTWPPTGPYGNEYTTAGVRSSVSDIVPRAMRKDFATQNTVQPQCPVSSKKQPEWRRRALRPLLRPTTPRSGRRLRQLGMPWSWVSTCTSWKTCVQRHCATGWHPGDTLPAEEGALVLGLPPARGHRQSAGEVDSGTDSSWPVVPGLRRGHSHRCRARQRLPVRAGPVPGHCGLPVPPLLVHGEATAMQQPDKQLHLLACSCVPRPVEATFGVCTVPDACSRRPCGSPKLQAHDVARGQEWPDYLPCPEHDLLGHSPWCAHLLQTRHHERLVCWWLALHRPGRPGSRRIPRMPSRTCGHLLIGRGAAAGPGGRELPTDLRHASVMLGVE